MDIKDNLNRSENIANAAKHLLERHGICSFGMLITEKDEELGYCYQKDNSFIFVNYGGEETKRPLMDFLDNDYKKRILRNSNRYTHRTHLLQYNEYESIYTLCSPSCKEHSSIYNQRGGGHFYIICSNGKRISIDMGYGYFEYINKPLYIYLTHHQFDENRNAAPYDGKYYDTYLSDAFFNKKTNELWECCGLIEYKEHIIINSIEPNYTIVFDKAMTRVFMRDESAVFCQLGQYAYLIFGESQISYNIDTNAIKQIEDLDEYDNYEIGLDYLIKHRITSYAKEEIIREDERYGQYENWVPKHDVTDATIYNSCLDIVRELHSPGIYNTIVKKEDKTLVLCSVDGDYAYHYYYDINRPEYIKYDAITREAYSVADIVEKQISDDIIIEEILNSTKADYCYATYEQDEFDDEDEIFACRIKIRKGKNWDLLNDDVYSSVTLQCFKYRGKTISTYLLAIRNRKHHEYDLYADEIKLIDKGKYLNQAIEVCEESYRIIFSDKDKFGIIGNGRIIVPSIYESIEYYHDYEDCMSFYVIQDENAFGIIDNDGNILLQCKYAMIKCHYDWYNNLYILISEDNKKYSWACCDKDTIFIDGTTIPDENSIIRPSWDKSESDDDDVIYVQVNYNIQTGEFGVNEKRFRPSKESEQFGWSDQELRDAADIAYEGHSRLELGLED